ncbi:suppressor protein SRP40-like [Magnolia sinica]|uniref:suppressor protein SRP40-like n=1 Tax=Magnolia sinica TaxID=86752 RepID=UPI00265859D8|nr:suppressor protein SRP40-like [Magnolia sinica]
MTTTTEDPTSTGKRQLIRKGKQVVIEESSLESSSSSSSAEGEDGESSYGDSTSTNQESSSSDSEEEASNSSTNVVTSLETLLALTNSADVNTPTTVVSSTETRVPSFTNMVPNLPRPSAPPEERQCRGNTLSPAPSVAAVCAASSGSLKEKGSKAMTMISSCDKEFHSLEEQVKAAKHSSATIIEKIAIFK